jgi:hypothetical protein
MRTKVVTINSGAINKARGRPFAPGNTLGRGRPKGSRNKAKSPEQALLDEFAPHLTRKCIALALQGDLSALRICMERVSPARRGSRIPIALPRIETVGDVDRAAEQVTQALRRGDLTPTEGSMLMNTLESRSRIIAKVPPDESRAPTETVIGDPGLAALTNQELEQLRVLTEKMECARYSDGQTDAPSAEEQIIL